MSTNDPKQKLHVQGDLRIASSLDGTSDTMLCLEVILHLPHPIHKLKLLKMMVT